MPISKLLGSVLLVGGLICLAFACQQSDSFVDQTKHLFTGEFRDKTSYMILGGAIATVLGLVSLLVPTRTLPERF